MALLRALAVGLEGSHLTWLSLAPQPLGDKTWSSHTHVMESMYQGKEGPLGHWLARGAHSASVCASSSPCYVPGIGDTETNETSLLPSRRKPFRVGTGSDIIMCCGDQTVQVMMAAGLGVPGSRGHSLDATCLSPAPQPQHCPPCHPPCPHHGTA